MEALDEIEHFVIQEYKGKYRYAMRFKDKTARGSEFVYNSFKGAAMSAAQTVNKYIKWKKKKG